METIIGLQVRVKDQHRHDLFKYPRFYGKLEGSTQLLVVSEEGNCHFYEVSDLDGYAQICIDPKYEDMYSFLE